MGQRRTAVACVFAAALVACGLTAADTRPGGEDTVSDSLGPIRGSFQLVSVAGQPPEFFQTLDECVPVPTESEYRFVGTRWMARDSMPLSRACAAQTALEYWSTVRVDSGSFRVSGDTVQFVVDDQRIGLNGWVNAMLIRGDTLIIEAGEFDPGDFVYVRTLPRDP